MRDRRCLLGEEFSFGGSASLELLVPQVAGMESLQSSNGSMSMIVSGDLPAFAHLVPGDLMSVSVRKVCESQYMVHPGGWYLFLEYCL